MLAEVVGNPGLEVLDLPAVAAIAHAHGLPLMVDATFITPCLCRPFEHGADIVVHSLTKWLGGHGVAIGGILVDGGRFDWQASGRFPTLTEPYPGYAGLTYAESFGPQAFAARARTEGLRDFGACLSPQNAFYLLLGIETLPLRMDRHIANTAAVLDFLAGHPAVACVVHPSLAEPSRPRARPAPAAERRRLDRQLRRQGRPRARAPGSSRPAGSPRTWPMSAMPRRW